MEESAVFKDGKGDYNGALVDLEEGVRLDPNNSRMVENRGKIKNKLGDTDGAIADYTKAIELGAKE